MASEAQHQAYVIKWSQQPSIRRQWPELALLHHIPNGGTRDAVEAKHLKQQGVKSGVPDLCLPVPRGQYHGLYIEMKTESGHTSDEEDFEINPNDEAAGTRKITISKHIFIELLRRGCDLFYHADKKECDFVVREGVRITQAYQVTVKMDDEKTRKREIEGLQEAMEIYDLSEGYIITLNEKEELTVDGKAVHIIPAWEWMLK